MVQPGLGVGDEDDGLAGLYASSKEAGSEYRERSVNLFADPKMRELKHYTKSHNHEHRLRANAELEIRPRASQTTPAADWEALASALRSEGCEVVNRHVKRLAAEKAAPPRPSSHGELLEAPREPADELDDSSLTPESREALLRRMSRFHTRLQWRDHMDQSLNRLMADIELARDERLKEYAHKARCGHLDKIYDWYVTHGMKEARKERAAPPYVRFSVDGPVMPGSMRVAPNTREGAATAASSPVLRKASVKEGHGMNHSLSLPSLAAVSRELDGRLNSTKVK